MDDWVVFDVEADGLDATKIYCLAFTDSSGTSSTLTDSGDIRDFFKRYKIYIGHNIIRWDIPTLRRLLGISSVFCVDTLAIAWYLDIGRAFHGLESYGEDFGVSKPKISDWYSDDLKAYIHRCEQDVRINIALWKDQWDRLLDIYDREEDALRFIRYLSSKMEQQALQEESRWKFDRDYCNEALEYLTELRDEKTFTLRAAMPKQRITRDYRKPAKLYRANGELSVLGRKWKDRTDEAGVALSYDGVITEVVSEIEGNPASHQQIKDWLYELGWKPRTFKTVRDAKSGELRDIPQVQLGPEKGGGVCESVKELYEKEENLELLDGLGILNHRISILRGFLRDASDDNYLVAKCAGFTNTLRLKHAELVNLPKPEKKYGEYIRRCLVASSPDCELCGSDMSSLEDRLKQHFLFRYDPDYVRELNTAGYDPHLDLAVLAGAITKEQSDGYKSADDRIVKLVKPIRAIYKNGNYACQYGAGVSRLAITCGCDQETARRVHETYWKRNWAIKAVTDNAAVKTRQGKLWLYNPISGFWYYLKTRKDIFSTLVQGSAAYCFDVWISIVLSERPQLTGQFHDEIIFEIQKGHRDEIKSFLKDCIQEANEFLGLNRELDVDVQFGSSYDQIH